MECYETTNGRLGMRDIPAPLAELLRKIPASGDSDSEEVEGRFFPSPSNALNERGLRDDWKAHVEPELNEIFQSARRVVEADLRGMKGGDEIFEVEFSGQHAEAWVSALNQARLALVARHQFEEDDLEAPPTQISSDRDVILLQVNFYGYVQQWLVEVLEKT